ncbi:PufQ cytochrome subunit [Loktanella sp. DSM 29012]|uniref:Protein pufQ n=1 Tax=Loktanella gaetbuli TaxID=2881335 RepID=A0ABS8BV21_9RHOB|nr:MULTISPECIES: cytochrome PufQ [Loktanella]KQI69856.1 protein pufQ [Loktanella sp. 3ANDIMAR09]MCB5199439.1 protein pufQ [Loktanella gaetbuli]SEP55582.1 PufQ cytochrome subunit [Loktanella sp. DSM 29012]
MTDFTTNQMVRDRTAPPKREYYAYFALIFAATLPLSLLTWVLKAARRMELPEKGPIASAWSQARIITPHIFSA